MLQILVIAIAVGIAALQGGEPAEPFLGFTRSRARDRAEGPVVGHPAGAARHPRPDRQCRRDLRLGAAGSLGSFAVAIYVGLALVLFVVYPVMLRTHGLSVRQLLLRRVAGHPAGLRVPLVDRHPAPDERVTERNLGVPRSYASFAVPLGATTKMDGCAAIYPAIAAIFVAQFFGIHLRSPTTCSSRSSRWSAPPRPPASPARSSC